MLSDLPVAPGEFIERLIRGVDDRRDTIDQLIGAHAIDWEPSRMPVVDLVIARIAAFELIAEPEVPTAVILSEAVELAQRYSTEGSGPFLNGILAAIADEVRG